MGAEGKRGAGKGRLWGSLARIKCNKTSPSDRALLPYPAHAMALRRSCPGPRRRGRRTGAREGPPAEKEKEERLGSTGPKGWSPTQIVMAVRCGSNYRGCPRALNWGWIEWENTSRTMKIRGPRTRAHRNGLGTALAGWTESSDLDPRLA